MTDPTSRHGTFPRGHHAYLTRQANAQLIARLSPDKRPATTTNRFEFPDPVDLRGIPVCGQGVGSTMPGTQPENAATR